MGGTTLTSTRALRYLGVVVDKKLSFREHLENACMKANEGVFNLSRIMANTVGPRTRKRRKTYRRKIAAAQRRGVLRVTCAYRTVLEAAVLVIAGAAPIDLLAFERAKIYNAKTNGDNSKEERAKIKTETLHE
ncbi:uncharacterized protein LOC141532657 [Cotesia typhae]|uniref:uncharacterized protein LOC141532657 n=1 Tax=Cotesia typhae TaxID=2053667 RepID=UPI003D69CCE1